MLPDYSKIVQSINYFARLHDDFVISKLVFLKLMFLADRYHIRMYGRLISNSHYVAMKYGPVASESKAVFEFLGLPESEMNYARLFLVQNTKNTLKSIAEIETDKLSKTDMEALSIAWKTYQNHPRIVAYTHRFPEWKRHCHELLDKNVVTMNMDDFFLPTDDDYCPADAERLELNRECFHEIADIL